MSLDALYRDAHARLVAAVGSRVGDLALAEDAVHDAFAAAAEQWHGVVPPHARAWLFNVARNKAVDRLRAAARVVADSEDALAALAAPGEAVTQDSQLPDERLRLVFTCCHPALAPEAQVALTLRSVAGLSTDDVARLFFAEPAAMAQRLVRAQRKIRDARIPWVVPGPGDWAERLTAVLAVVYLVFTSGYAAHAPEPCDEAVRLGRLLVELLPHEGEVLALLALMLLHDSRRDARVRDGAAVLLEEQDRRAWDSAKIHEGLAVLDDALSRAARGVYAVQAAIAAVHARAAAAADTDWDEICALYDALVALQPTPIVRLNRAAARAMALGPEVGLRDLDELRRFLDENYLFHAARARLLGRLGRRSEATTAYRSALALATAPADRRFLELQMAAQ